MSFLKKHWRLTVLAVVVLCALLVVVVLYSTSETPEPKRVYTMPERTPHNPSASNTDRLPPTKKVPINKNDETTESHTVSGDINSSDSEAIAQTSPVDDYTTSPLSYEEAKAIAREITEAETPDVDLSNLDGALERFEAEFALMNEAVASSLTDSPDTTAKALSNLSLSQRNDILDGLRLIAADRVDDFVAQMNKRGIHFE